MIKIQNGYVSISLPNVGGKQICMVVTTIGNVHYIPANNREELEIIIKPILQQGERIKEVYLAIAFHVSSEEVMGTE